FPFLLDRPEILRWRATMWIDGGRPADRARATEDLLAARSDYERFGMPRHVTLVDEALGKRT
ncbi:MAG: hypothetical protein GWO02_22690, partial [Gammaproteobacteria bacterium]|nr:hypothetical protein [Gammaproteobacteria bacterium]